MTLLYPSRKRDVPFLQSRRPEWGLVVEFGWVHIITPWFMLSAADPEGAFDVNRNVMFSGVILQTKRSANWPRERLFAKERKFIARLIDVRTKQSYPDTL